MGNDTSQNTKRKKKEKENAPCIFLTKDQRAANSKLKVQRRCRFSQLAVLLTSQASGDGSQGHSLTHSHSGSEQPEDPQLHLLLSVARVTSEGTVPRQKRLHKQPYESNMNNSAEVKARKDGSPAAQRGGRAAVKAHFFSKAARSSQQTQPAAPFSHALEKN